MKYSLLLMCLMFIGHSLQGQINPLDVKLQHKSDYEAAAQSFSKGEAEDAQQYYLGILSEIVLIDGYLQQFVQLDKVDAPIAQFQQTIRSCESGIERTKKSLKLYKKNKWALREKMERRTLNWVNSVQSLIDRYIVDLDEPFSREDSTWVEADYSLYKKYVYAYEDYLDIDQQWVDFQYEFAKANNFSIKGEIDPADIVVNSGQVVNQNAK